MLLVARRRPSKTTAGILVLLALSAASTTLSQPAEQQTKIEDLQEAIERMESRAGETSEELIDPLTTLARLYQEAGKPLQSAAAIRRALDLMHVNEGLHT